MSASPNFAATAQNSAVQVSVANTARDGTGTITTVATGAANGSRIDDISIVATGTTTAGVIRLFLTVGGSTRLWKEILVPANTPSTSNPVWSYSISNLSLVLASGAALKASTHNAETFNVITTRHGDM